MAEDQELAGYYAFDENGIRRWLAEGDELPDGWSEDEPEEEDKPTPQRAKRKS